MFGCRVLRIAVGIACVLTLPAVASQSPVHAQGESSSQSSAVAGFIEFEGGGRPTERLEIYVQTPTGGSRFRIFSDPGGTFFIRSLRQGTYEFNVKVPRAWPYSEGFAELILLGSPRSSTTYTVTVYLKRKLGPGITGVSGRTMTAQETDEKVAKEAKRHYRRGVDAARASKSSEAIASFRKALEIEPDYLFALNDLGVQLTKRGSYEEAIDVLRRAAKLAPKSFPPRLNMALALLLANRNDEAAIEIGLAIELDSSAAEAPFLSGILEKRRGNRESAVAAFQKAYELGGVDVIFSQYELGQLYEELKQPEAAARAYRIFLQFVQRGPQADRARRQLKTLDLAA